MLGHMTPRRAVHDVADHRFLQPVVDSESCHRDTARCVPSSDFSDLFCGDLGVSVLLAAWDAVGINTGLVALASRNALRVRMSAVPAFTEHVLRVLLMGGQKQMAESRQRYAIDNVDTGRTVVANAGPVVASVADEQARGQRAIAVTESRAAGSNDPAVADICSVAVGVDLADPLPAFTVESRPGKQCCWGDSARSVVAGSATEDARRSAVEYGPGLHAEDSATLSAGTKGNGIVEGHRLLPQAVSRSGALPGVAAPSFYHFRPLVTVPLLREGVV